MNVPLLCILCLICTAGCVHQREETSQQAVRLVTTKTDLIIATAREAALAKFPEAQELKISYASHFLLGDADEEIQVRFETPSVVLKEDALKPDTSTQKGSSILVRLDVFGRLLSVDKNDFRTFQYITQKRVWDKIPDPPKTPLSSEAKAPEMTTAATGVISVLFGERLSDGSLKPTRKITWKPGNRYGWDVIVFSKVPSVKIKEILTLPDPATFVDRSAAPSSLKSNQSTRISADQKTLVKEFTLDTSKAVKHTQTFKILETDPKGTHRFQIFINDTLASDMEFEIGN